MTNQKLFNFKKNKKYATVSFGLIALLFSIQMVVYYAGAALFSKETFLRPAYEYIAAASLFISIINALAALIIKHDFLTKRDMRGRIYAASALALQFLFMTASITIKL